MIMQLAKKSPNLSVQVTARTESFGQFLVKLRFDVY